MDVPAILAIIGGIAFLVGLFGGGVKAKEIELPRIPRWSRVLSCVMGLALIGLAIGLSYLKPVELAETGVTSPATVIPDRLTTTPVPPTNTPAWTPTSTRSPTPSPTPPVLSGLLFEENFDNNRNEWPSGKDENGTYYVEDGEYHVIGAPSRGGGGWLVPHRYPVPSFNDFYLETQVRFIEGTQRDDAYGMLFRRSGSGPYVFMLGLVQQLYSLHDERETLLWWSYSPRIVTGNGANVVGILCDGDTMTFFINGHRVDSFQDSHRLSGEIGLAFGSDIHFAVDYIRVWALSR